MFMCSEWFNEWMVVLQNTDSEKFTFSKPHGVLAAMHSILFKARRSTMNYALCWWAVPRGLRYALWCAQHWDHGLMAGSWDCYCCGFWVNIVMLGRVLFTGNSNILTIYILTIKSYWNILYPYLPGCIQTFRIFFAHRLAEFKRESVLPLTVNFLILWPFKSYVFSRNLDFLRAIMLEQGPLKYRGLNMPPPITQVAGFKISPIRSIHLLKTTTCTYLVLLVVVTLGNLWRKRVMDWVFIRSYLSPFSTWRLRSSGSPEPRWPRKPRAAGPSWSPRWSRTRGPRRARPARHAGTTWTLAACGWPRSYRSGSSWGWRRPAPDCRTWTGGCGDSWLAAGPGRAGGRAARPYLPWISTEYLYNSQNVLPLITVLFFQQFQGRSL